MRTTALLGFVLLTLIFVCRRAPSAAVRTAATPPQVAVSSTAALAVALEPEHPRPEAELDAIFDPEISSARNLAVRLRAESSEAHALAILIALGRLGDREAMPALVEQVMPDRPFRAAQALQSMHQIGCGTIAAKLAHELLRSPYLANADPVYHAAAVVTGQRIDDVVAELAEEGPEGTVRDQALRWMEQRKLSIHHPPCAEEHP